jgi:uncharacterized protein YbjT (DUF2867 family)
MRILVTGATGYVGSRLITELLSRGHQVVAASRNVERLADFGWYDEVTPVVMDAHDVGSVESALVVSDPIDVIYYLVHGIGQQNFRDADNVAASNVAAAAKEAGVRRIVYLGGFVPADGDLSEHLTSRAEVAEALSIEGGPELVWLGAAMIIGAGSTSFEMLRYVGDRFLLLPEPKWTKNPMDPISIRDVLYYLAASADEDVVPAGAYDICGPETTTYGDLLAAYGRATGKRRASVPIRGVDTSVVSMVTSVVLPVPSGLAADLVESLDYPMKASSDTLRKVVPDPPGGLVPIDVAIARSLAGERARPVDELADPHHLADTDPVWAGGDVLRIQRLARSVMPPVVRPVLELLNAVPGPVVAVMRDGIDTLISLTPKVRPA